MEQTIGALSPKIIMLLGLNLEDNQPIFLGESNINHMLSRHPGDFQKYGHYIAQILSSPDYVGQNPKDGSIEYVKEFQIDNEFVKVAVRLSGGGKLYARSLYVLNNNRVNNFIKRGTLKKFDEFDKKI